MINCSGVACNGCGKETIFDSPRSIEQTKDWCKTNGWTIRDIYTICGDCVKRVLTSG